MRQSTQPSPSIGSYRFALAALAAAVACGGVLASNSRAIGVASPAAPTRASAAANRAFAQAEAESLLGRLVLPPGAVSSVGEPPGDGSALAVAAEHPATANLVDDTGWWRLAGTQQAAIAYIESHPPAGSKLVGTGSGSGGVDGTTLVWASFGWPAVRNVLGSRTLVVEAAQLSDGATGLRVDAQVVWTTPRPASERIPAGTVRLRITVTGEFSAHKPRQRPVVVDAAGKIRAITALINTLPLVQPGATSCLADSGVRVRVSFERAHHALPAAVAVINTAGCKDVQLTLEGRAQPPLSGLDPSAPGGRSVTALIGRIESILGVALKTRAAHGSSSS
jgi:hypothetical protein